MTELFDLAATMRNEGMEAAAIEIDYLDHLTTARRLAREIGVRVDDLGLEGILRSEERLVVGTHYGTHLDAPTHYADEVAGAPAATVDRMPLGPLLAPAVLLDFSDRAAEPITATDLELGYAALGIQPSPGQMLITRVGVEDDYLSDPMLRERGAGMDGSAIEWLLSHGVRLTATDSMTQDMPIPWMEERFAAGDREAYFPVHLAGKRQHYVHVEKAFGLRGLPTSKGFWVAAFPIKVEGGSGAWTRFHAITDPPFDPRAARVVDLSQPIRRHSMEPYNSEITTHDSERRRRQWAKHLRVRVEEVEPRGSWDLVQAVTRAGTHLEAPFHFGPECDGRPARTMAEVPLDWCFGPAVVLDVSQGPREIEIDRAELVSALDRVGHRLRGGDIVLLRTGADRHFDGDPSFPEQGRGLAVGGLELLVEAGVRVVGTDAETLDRPLGAMLADLTRGRRDALYPVLRAGRRLEHCQVLKLARLEVLPPTGAWASVAPIKVEGAGAGWCRAVGIVPEHLAPGAGTV